MTQHEAIKLIQKGVRKGASIWADFGAGSGTRALSSLLGSVGIVYAIDQHPAIAQSIIRESQAKIQVIQSDIMAPLNLPQLDGAIVANVLHYTPAPKEWLVRIRSYIRRGGILIVIEYDTDHGNPWVPYPLPQHQLVGMLEEMRLGDYEEIGRKRSRYGHREIYSMVVMLNSSP